MPIDYFYLACMFFQSKILIPLQTHKQ